LSDRGTGCRGSPDQYSAQARVAMQSKSVAVAVASALALGAVLLVAGSGGGWAPGAWRRLQEVVIEEPSLPAEAAAAAVAEASKVDPRLRGADAPIAERSASASMAVGESKEAAIPEMGPPLDAPDTSSGIGMDRYRDCLCLFDIDRTLTGKQGLVSPRCPSNVVIPNVWDDAYGGGDLTLSHLARAGVYSTQCRACKIGIVSHGYAGGNTMKGIIEDLIQSPSHRWSTPGNIHSPMVLGCGYKPPCVQGVMDWYNRHGSNIKPYDVFMFDDKRSNIHAFYGTPFNAHRISCRALDGEIGLCGAEAAEISLRHGVSSC